MSVWRRRSVGWEEVKETRADDVPEQIAHQPLQSTTPSVVSSSFRRSDVRRLHSAGTRRKRALYDTPGVSLVDLNIIPWDAVCLRGKMTRALLVFLCFSNNKNPFRISL